MKSLKIIMIIAVGGLFLNACNSTTNQKLKEETMKEENLLRHVVIFKFNDSTSSEQVEKLNKSFVDLQNHISIIQDFEWGLNDSPEDFHQGFTHCYMLTFKSEEDRDSIYTLHPKHQEFVASLGSHVEKVFVVDYWAN